MKGKPRIYAIDFDAISLKFVSSLCERHRVIFMTRFDFRSTDFTRCFTGFSVFDVVKKKRLEIYHNAAQRLVSLDSGGLSNAVLSAF